MLPKSPFAGMGSPLLPHRTKSARHKLSKEGEFAVTEYGELCAGGRWLGTSTGHWRDSKCL